MTDDDLHSAGATTVLLADDHPATRAGVRARFDAQADMFVVGEAGDGARAVELIQRDQPDVAVVDLRMPLLDGLGVLEQVAAGESGTRIVLLSALTEAHLVLRALDLGASGYVGKDSPIDAIVDCVRVVARGSRYIDPTLATALLEPTENPLTERERQVLQLAANGQQNKVIAIELGLSEETVKSHLSNVMRKLGANSRTEAVAAAMRQYLIQ